MNKRIVTSLFVIALAAALVGGATMAWFTDSAKVEGNSFTAGTVVVNLDGDTTDGSAYFEVDNMAPGDGPIVKFIEVRNDGTLPIYFNVYIDDVVSTAPNGGKIEDVLDVTFTLRPAGYTVDGYSLYGGGQVYGPVKLSSLIGFDNGANNTEAIPLDPGYVAVYKIEVSMPTSAGNEYQGSSFSGTLHVHAVQSDNQESPVNWDI